jgi:hypothetical protein
MEIQRQQPTTKAPAQTFTGDAWFDVIAAGQEPSRLWVNVVRFAPGARNAQARATARKPNGASRSSTRNTTNPVRAGPGPDRRPGPARRRCDRAPPATGPGLACEGA